MLNLFNYRYLNHNHLKGFENYVYNSKDTSPLSKYVMHPFWNVVVKLVPIWLAPNVLTFVGFLLTATNGLLLTIYDPHFYASSDTFPQYPPIPSWVWIFCAIFHFVAHTLDGIDGKHARRTKSSGPLGELMDHGMDSWTAFFIPFCIYSIFGRADYSQTPFHMHFIFWSIYVTFYLSHWEKYNTGILYLPWSYDVSQMALFILYLITYSYGHQIWKFTVPVLNLTSGQMFELISYITSFFLSVPIAFYNVYTCKTSKQKNFWESFRPLVSLIVLFLNSTLWAVCSPNDIIEAEPRTFYFMVGTIFSNIACRLIVSQMSSTKCEVFNWFLYPLTISTMSAIFWNHNEREMTLLRLNALFYTIFHIHYAVCVVRQMCHHFKIYCFSLDKPETIKSPELENLEAAKEATLSPNDSNFLYCKACCQPGFDVHNYGIKTNLLNIIMNVNVKDGESHLSIPTTLHATCVPDSNNLPVVSTTQIGPTTSQDDSTVSKFKNKKRQPKYRATKRPQSERRFQCDQCESRFFTQKDVKRHMVVHTGVRNFACPFCEQRFGRKDHLVRHAKKSHDQDTRSFKRRNRSSPTSSVSTTTDLTKKTKKFSATKKCKMTPKPDSNTNFEHPINYTTASPTTLSNNQNIYFNRDSTTSSSYESYNISSISIFSNSTSIPSPSASLPKPQATLVDSNNPDAFTSYGITHRNYSANFDNYSYSNYLYNVCNNNDFNSLNESSTSNYIMQSSSTCPNFSSNNYTKTPITIETIPCCLPHPSNQNSRQSSTTAQVTNNDVPFKNFATENFNNSIDMEYNQIGIANFHTNLGSTSMNEPSSQVGYPNSFN